MAAPVDIAHSRGRNLLVVTWDHGAVDELSGRYLRGWCPCAACQGHGTVVTFRAPAEDVEITGLEEVGAYALGIRFSDGHDSGIFTWSWLEQIAPRSEPPGEKFGSFEGGVYRPPRTPPSGGANGRPRTG